MGPNFRSKQKRLLRALILEQVAFLGITAGAHRLWSHRSYKARWPLRVFLCILNSVAFQNDIYIWCRDHRLHHKFTETDADPHNIKRGFFFAHIGWLMCRKHPEVAKKGKTIFVEDLMADPIVRFQRRWEYFNHFCRLLINLL
ncbi:Stearoyl-CoA desaturase 5 [Araneus ventricosus]|uniref:Stearoyl-CoA desaturase 5 n=1 Tax=Araneus ventricosus TaxID=182803 RepID=A0A4Y2H6G3_ARAVE|nr:Stearoyl-CoA desaturase 5 [Araneus ventricosus]